MGDVPSKEGNGVGQIRATSQVTDSRLLFNSVPMKMAAERDLDILVVFLVSLVL